jgi:hypothetical protein
MDARDSGVQLPQTDMNEAARTAADACACSWTDI